MKKEEDPYKRIEVAKLRLDPNNPRLPETLRASKSEQGILEWMLTDATLIDLMASIAENGFFEGEPIIAMPEDEGYVVLEGNRRLAAVKLLQNPALSSKYKTALESLAKIAQDQGTLPESLMVFICKSREEVENYLGFRHFSGVKDWPPISKARYAYLLFSKKRDKGDPVNNDLFKELAREIGSKGPNVRKFVYSYLIYKELEQQEFYGIKDLNEDSFDFAILYEAAFKFGEISKYMGIDAQSENPLKGLDRNRLKEVVHWLFEQLPSGTGVKKTRVGESRNMRILDDVLKNEESRVAFIEGASLKEAAMLTNKPDDNFAEYLNRAKQVVQQAFNTVNQVKFPQRKEIELLNEISDTIDDMKLILERKIRNVERESKLKEEEIV